MAGCTHHKIQNPPELEEQEEEVQEEEWFFQSQDYHSLEPSVVVGNHLSKLRLDTTFKSSTTTTIGSSSASISNSIPMKTLKRRSPSDSQPIHQPNPKKEKLSLPPPHPLLRRCISDPFNSTAPPANTVTEITPPASADNKASGAVAASTSNNINSKPTFCRSISDPNPCPSPALKTISRASSSSSSSSSGDDDDNTSPNSKRLTRIKNRVREISRWFQQVMLDDDDHQEVEEPQDDHHQQNGAAPTDQYLNYNPNSASATDQLEDDRERKFEESVSVERMEESLVIHFRCNCGLPYKFLLAGGNCYYKLM